MTTVSKMNGWKDLWDKYANVNIFVDSSHLILWLTLSMSILAEEPRLSWSTCLCLSCTTSSEDDLDLLRKCLFFIRFQTQYFETALQLLLRKSLQWVQNIILSQMMIISRRGWQPYCYFWQSIRGKGSNYICSLSSFQQLTVKNTVNLQWKKRSFSNQYICSVFKHKPSFYQINMGMNP